jgi:hypothetical protein
MENACHCSVQNFVLPFPMSKTEMEICKTIGLILLLVLQWARDLVSHWNVVILKEEVWEQSMRIFGSNREEVTRGWKKLDNK